MDALTFQFCKDDREIRRLKIQNLEHAIEQSETMIAESKMDANSLMFLRKKVAESKQELEALYLLIFNEQC